MTEEVIACSIPCNSHDDSQDWQQRDKQLHPLKHTIIHWIGVIGAIAFTLWVMSSRR